MVTPDGSRRALGRSPLYRKWRMIFTNWELYLLFLPVAAYYVLFCYVPMYGVQIAFRDFSATRGIWGSEFVGLEHFGRFFSGYFIGRLLSNTIVISLYSLAVGFPIPIILALLLNETPSKRFKRSVQTITYAPHFLSTVVAVGMLIAILANNGLVNNMIRLFGGEPIKFMTEPGWFKTIYVFSGVWQSMGWSSIIYLAALSGIDPQLLEAAQIDGATRLQRIWHINLPGILPTIIILLILNSGSLMSVGFEKVFLMQNASNMVSSDVISTYVYRTGIQGVEYSFSAAVGLFNSVVNLIFLTVTNKISRVTTEASLW